MRAGPGPTVVLAIAAAAMAALVVAACLPFDEALTTCLASPSCGLPDSGTDSGTDGGADVDEIAYQIVRWPSSWSVVSSDLPMGPSQSTSFWTLTGLDPARSFVIGGGQWSNGVSTGVFATRSHALGSARFTPQIVTLFP